MPVLLPVALDQTYDYLLPRWLEAAPGAFVLVPFGPQTRIGVVWDGPSAMAASRSPTRSSRPSPPACDVPPLPAISLRFAEWVARYTLAPLGMVVRMMMGSSAVFEPVKPRFGVSCNAQRAEPPRMTPARKRALEIAADGLSAPRARSPPKPAARPASIDGLVEAGTLVEVAIPERRLPAPNPAHAARRVLPSTRRAPCTPCAPPPMPRPSPSRCSTASPAPARPRSTSRRWRARSRRAARR